MKVGKSTGNFPRITKSGLKLYFGVRLGLKAAKIEML